MQPRNRHRLAFALVVLVVLAAAGLLAAGPFIAIHGLRKAIAAQDTAALERYVDFPALRVNLKAQVEDALARRMGEGAQSSLLGSLGAQVAGGLAGGAVDAMVTPLGIGALLQGRGLLKRLQGQTVGGDTYAAPVPADPFRQMRWRYEGISQFNATVRDGDGDPVTVIFERQGLRWRVTDLRFDPPQP